MPKSARDTVAIPQDALEYIEANRRTQHHNLYEFEPWQDELILKYWNKYYETGVSQETIADALGKAGKRRPSDKTIRRRFEELNEQPR